MIFKMLYPEKLMYHFSYLYFVNIFQNLIYLVIVMKLMSFGAFDLMRGQRGHNSKDSPNHKQTLITILYFSLKVEKVAYSPSRSLSFSAINYICKIFFLSFSDKIVASNYLS